ncbi:MAG: hypothetical protein ACRER2_13775 [Methylococcales bacterium]
MVWGLVVVNTILFASCWTDFVSLANGLARVFHCGNLGIVGQRLPGSKGISPKFYRDLFLQMGEQTDVRGRQAGGVAVLGSLGFILKKIVNTKRGDLSGDLMSCFRLKLLGSRLKGNKPLDGIIHIVAHYRYGTSSAPAVRETHPHRWGKPRRSELWSLAEGGLSRKKKAVEIFMSRAQGSFGLVATSSLYPGQVALSAFKQPLSVGVSPETHHLFYASEPVALKSAALELPGGIPYRHDLEDGETVLLRVAPTGTPNEVVSHNRLHGENRAYVVTAEDLAGNPDWIDTNPDTNQYMTPIKPISKRKDGVKAELDDVPHVILDIEKSWSDPGSHDRQTAEQFVAALRHPVVQEPSGL